MISQKCFSLFTAISLFGLAPTPPARAFDWALPVMHKEDYKPVTGKMGGRIVLPIGDVPDTLNYYESTSAYTQHIVSDIFQGLVGVDPFSGEMTPLLAKSWSLSSDGTTWTFKLRDDVSFNDGTRFTADDVIFTWSDVVFDKSRPKSMEKPRWQSFVSEGGTFRTANGKVETVEVERIDDYTVKFRTPQPVPGFLYLLMNPILSQKSLRETVAKGEFPSALSMDSKSSDIVGTGPFMFKDYDRFSHKIALKRNPYYYKKDKAGQSLPYLDQVIYLVMPDDNAMMLNFQQNITDAVPAGSGATLLSLRKLPKQDFKIYDLGLAWGRSYLLLNQNLNVQRPEYKVNWFRDRRFRQAVSFAIDRNAISRSVYRMLAEPAYAPLSPNHPYANPELKPFPFDQNQSLKLLAEMGIKTRNGQSVLTDEAGHEVSFTVLTVAKDPLSEEEAAMVVHDLNTLGMKVNVLKYSFNVLLEELMTKHQFDAIILGQGSNLDPRDMSDVFESNHSQHYWNPSQKTPSTDWEAHLDEILNRAKVEMNPERRRADYNEWQKIVHDEQPLIYLSTGRYFMALRDKFANIFPAPMGKGNGGSLIYNLDEIFLK